MRVFNFLILLLILLLGLSSCSGGVLVPVPRESVQAASYVALESVLTGDSAAASEAVFAARNLAEESDRRSHLNSGLSSAFALMEAVISEREKRIELLESEAGDSVDPLARKIAWGLLEADDLWLANELKRDAIYSRFAGFWNGLLQMGYAALQGNPLGVARPIVTGVEGVVQRDAIRPRDRKKILLHRRWVRRSGDAGLDEDEFRDLQDDVETLRLSMLEEELLLAERLRAEGCPEASLAHADIARRLGADAAVVDALEAAIQSDVEARTEGLVRSLSGVVRASAADGVEAESLLLEFNSDPDPDPDPDPDTDTDASGRDPDDARRDEVAGQNPNGRLEQAQEDYRDAQWRYVLTGRRSSADPLLRRREVRRDMQRSITDVLSVVLWPPIALVRGVYTLAGDPIDDQPLVDALAASALAEPRVEKREEWLAELLDRYERRGELQKALGIARAFDGEEERVLELEEALADREGPAAPVDPSSSIPFGALGDLAGELGLALGSPVPRRVEVIEGGVRYAIDPEDPVEFEVHPDLHRRLKALADEWQWRRIALARAGYAEITDGVPVSLQAGLGASGVSVIPRFLPESYVARDRVYFE